MGMASHGSLILQKKYRQYGFCEKRARIAARFCQPKRRRPFLQRHRLHAIPVSALTDKD